MLKKKDVTIVHRLWYKEFLKALLVTANWHSLGVTNKGKYENTNIPTVSEENYGNG